MSKEQLNNKYFAQAEAEGKVGKRVQTRVDFSGVPKGSTGTVINADPAGATRIGDITQAIYDVAIQWDNQTTQAALAEVGRRLEKADENENTIERTAQLDRLLEEQDLLLSIDSNNPLVDWFTKAEYERFLDELPLSAGNSVEDYPF